MIIPPTLAGRLIKRHKFGVRTNASSNWTTHNIQELIRHLPIKLKHIAFECRTHEERRNTIDEGVPDQTTRDSGPGRVCQEEQGVPKQGT